MDQPTSLRAARRPIKIVALAVAVTGALAAGMLTAPPESASAGAQGGAAASGNGWTGVDGYPWRSTRAISTMPVTASWSYYTTQAQHAETASAFGAATVGASQAAGKVAAARNQVLLASRRAAVASRSAPTSSRSAPAGTHSVSASSIGAQVVAAAARLKGIPYRYGAAGPSSFDCSGFTLYVFRQFGVYLPHKADSQRHYGRAVSRADARPGDLIVVLSGGYGTHAGIYAGNGYMWDSPHSGSYVGLHKVWSTNVVFRRLV